MTTALEKYRAALQRRAEVEAEVKSEVQAAFGEMATAIFEQHPDITGFAWAQYTPYFNDGDACTFSANIDEITIRAKVPPKEGDYDVEEHAEGEWNHQYCGWSEPVLYEWMKNKPQKEQDDWLAARRKDFEESRAENPVLLPACVAIKKFLAEFHDDLEGLFGDHVQVWVTPDGVTPEEYCHD